MVYWCPKHHLMGLTSRRTAAAWPKEKEQAKSESEDEPIFLWFVFTYPLM